MSCLKFILVMLLLSLFSCYPSSQDTWVDELINAEKNRVIDEQNKIEKLISRLEHDDSAKNELISFGNRAHSLLITKIKISDIELAVKCASVLEVTGDSSIGNKMIELLASHYSPEIRLRAARFIGKLGDKFYFPYLEKSLVSEQTYIVRQEIVTSIGKLRDKRSLALLSSMLKPGDPLSPHVASSFGEIASEDQVYLLIDFFNSGNVEDRIHSAVALGKIGGKSAVDQLKKSLKADHHDRVREACARGLGIAGEKTAISDLVSALEDKSDLVFFLANNSLEKITGISKLTFGDTTTETRSLTAKHWREWLDQNK